MRSKSLVKENGLKTKPYVVIIFQRSLVQPFAIFPFKGDKNAERPIVTKTKIIRYKNHESSMRTCTHLGYMF